MSWTVKGVVALAAEKKPAEPRGHRDPRSRPPRRRRRHRGDRRVPCTDLAYRDGGINDEFPFLLGHESAGRVSAIGEDVTHVEIGDYVVLNWRAVCGECRACKKGVQQYCFDTHNASKPMTLTDGTGSPPPSASAPSRRRPWSTRASARRSPRTPWPRSPACWAAA